MSAIVERLLQAIPTEALRLESRVTALRSESPHPGGAGRPRWMVSTERGATEAFHAVVLALGAVQAAPLLRPLDGDLADRLAATPYGSSTTVSLGYREADVRRSLDGFGFVVPRAENRPLIACSFSSVKFPERAPEGCVLLRAFTSETLVPGRDEEQAISVMRDQMRDLLGISAAPLLARAWFHPGSMAQYDVGHLERVAEVESRLGRRPGLALAGNGLRGVGVPDCVRSGEAAADLVLSQAPLLVA
jgi:oxygen-dependent protoporphyrinogen oxidase